MIEDKSAKKHDYDQILLRLAEWLDRNIDLPPERMEDNMIRISFSLLTQLFILGLQHRGMSLKDIAHVCGIKSTNTISKWRIGETVPDWDKIVILGHVYHRSRLNNNHS